MVSDVRNFKDYNNFRQDTLIYFDINKNNHFSFLRTGKILNANFLAGTFCVVED